LSGKIQKISTQQKLENNKCSCFDSRMIQVCTKKTTLDGYIKTAPYLLKVGKIKVLTY